jgi:shikimate dehydrogenase
MPDAATSVYGIIGNPVRHSFSPVMHNSAFAKVGINAVYVAFEVNNLHQAIDGIRGLEICGVSVTIPHKISVIPLLDEVEEIADMIGSVNTIINRNGNLIGTNTDAYGFYRALSEKISIDGKTVAVLGSGGASRAICFALFHYAKPKKVLLFAARPEDTEQARELSGNVSSKIDNSDISAVSLSDWSKYKNDIEIVINTTPLGMHPLEDLSPLKENDFDERMTVMDIVYNPHQTRFLSIALEKGCNICYGIDMLLYQGIRQFELWTNSKAPVDVMRKVLTERINKAKK